MSDDETQSMPDEEMTDVRIGVRGDRVVLAVAEHGLAHLLTPEQATSMGVALISAASHIRWMADDDGAKMAPSDDR